MKTLALGFVGAALTLALTAPGWAQGPMMKAPSLTMPGKDTCATRHRTYKTHRTHGGGASGDNSANMLNAQELSRLQGGGAPAPTPAPMPGPMPPGGNNPTSGTAGPLYQR
jgi:hypothetical protein